MEGSPDAHVDAQQDCAAIKGTWWTHNEVCAHLRIDPRTVVARMKETPDHIDRPWVNYGTTRRPYYRWQAKGVDRWWVKVNDWRTAAERTQRRRVSAQKASRSSAQFLEAGGQSLAEYVRSLTSKKS